MVFTDRLHYLQINFLFFFFVRLVLDMQLKVKRVVAPKFCIIFSAVASILRWDCCEIQLDFNA